MRNGLLTLAVGTIAAAGPISAQAGIGIVGGYVSSNVSVDPATAGTTWSARPGFAGGLSLGVHVAQGVSLAVEGLYVQKGADAQIGIVSGSEKLTYVEVPLLLRIAIGDPRKPHLFLTAGGQYSSLLTCTTVSAGFADVDCKASATATSGIKSSDYGVIFGGGVASRRISLSVRYDLGLDNLNRDTSVGQATAKNKAFMVLVGIGL